ncbi:hypothetical protein SI65_10024 [Aspergillus cristatus]|uniref:Uncharacterized protein n=1 Tax=Aspergillus cristatus TaxID=573508 RepID=A0A1E3B0T6_ASPCR|nr:hypothetical protein SI65_10024 [Aspergillus cristatus]
MPRSTNRSATIFSRAERLQRILAEMTLEEAMEEQLEKWKIERAILSRMVLSMDFGTPGYWEVVNILLGHYDVAAMGG